MKQHHYFLAKSEPDVYSIAGLAREQRTTWDGVRNAQARNAIRSMKPGDIVLIYHSGENPSVVGVARVVSPPSDDPTDSKMTVVDVEYVHTLGEPVTLKSIKQSGLFEDFALVRQSRLSTMEAPLAFISWLKKQRPELQKLL